MSEKRDYFDFPDAMFPLSAALALNHVPVDVVEITLPFQHWWNLWSAIDRKHRGIMTWTGVGQMPQSFQYMGFKFTAKDS